MERKKADKDLEQCVLAKTHSHVLALVMYRGVRFGGSPYFYNWYRWGYGWPFERKYHILTDQETWRADELVGQFLDDITNEICK